jgi:hypothetical protein
MCIAQKLNVILFFDRIFKISAQLSKSPCIYKQCGNWNKIHNLDIGDFCKENPETSQFLFFLAHILTHFEAYGFCISAPGSLQPPQTFFFK